MKDIWLNYYAKGDGWMKDHAKSCSLDDHMSLTAEVWYELCVNASSCIDGASNNSQDSLSVDRRASSSSLHNMINTAYGDKLLYSDGGPHDSAWCQHWSVINQHKSQYYSLPGGSMVKS